MWGGVVKPERQRLRRFPTCAPCVPEYVWTSSSNKYSGPPRLSPTSSRRVALPSCRFTISVGVNRMAGGVAGGLANRLLRVNCSTFPSIVEWQRSHCSTSESPGESGHMYSPLQFSSRHVRIGDARPLPRRRHLRRG